MPKPPPHRAPDPMAGVVDRLLAQLPGLQSQPEPPRPPMYRPPVQFGVGGSVRTPATGEPQAIGMWARVLLGLMLAIMMGWWPYARACGLPLFGYLCAVTTVMLAGSWAATASWRNRSGLAHTIAVVLVFYGIALGVSELLPRTGYAVNHATWACDDAASLPALVLNQQAGGW